MNPVVESFSDGSVGLALFNRRGEVIATTRIDRVDLALASRWRWCRGRAHGYAVARYRINGKDEFYCLHRELLFPVPDGFVVDHINGDPLDNRRCNLRLATPAQNTWNSGQRRGREIRRGVYLSGSKWMARIALTCDSLEEAVAQRERWERETYGDFARKAS